MRAFGWAASAQTSRTLKCTVVLVVCYEAWRCSGCGLRMHIVYVYARTSMRNDSHQVLVQMHTPVCLISVAPRLSDLIDCCRMQGRQKSEAKQGLWLDKRQSDT